MPPDAEQPLAEDRTYRLRVGPPADRFYLSAFTDAGGAPLGVTEAGPAAVATIVPQALFVKLDDRSEPRSSCCRPSPCAAARSPRR